MTSIDAPQPIDYLQLAITHGGQREDSVAQWHHIFCRSDTALPREELADYITGSWYGDGLPNITSAPRGTAWHELIVEFPGAPAQRLDLLLDSAPQAVAELVNEFLHEHGEQISPEVANFLQGSQQVVSIGFKPDHLNDDTWELLDQTQAFIAKRLNGELAIIGDGVYDRDLQLQVHLGQSPT